jgi:ubiquinone/menaquinone biosynthesis C-methylase UbiE
MRCSVGASHEGEAAQTGINAYFDSTAVYWDRVYRGDDLQDLIYQRRQSRVLSYVDADVAQPAHAHALEIGCGAGHLTVELARRVAEVDAVDASRAMVDATAARLQHAGSTPGVRVRQADVHALPFASEEFDLLVAVGVIPWLHTPQAAVTEMARVLRPGGRMVLTADNRLRLTSFTDPRRVVAIPPLKRLRRALRKIEPVADSHMHSPRTVLRMLASAGLCVQRGTTVGFGPLSLMGRPVLDGSVGVAIDRRLQALADRGAPGVRSTGWHYVVSAEKR